MKNDEEFEIELPERPRAFGQLPGWFVTKFDTACIKCQVPIYDGEWARFTDDGIVCTDCGSEEEAE